MATARMASSIHSNNLPERKQEKQFEGDEITVSQRHNNEINGAQSKNDLQYQRKKKDGEGKKTK